MCHHRRVLLQIAARTLLAAMVFLGCQRAAPSQAQSASTRPRGAPDGWSADDVAVLQTALRDELGPQKPDASVPGRSVFVPQPVRVGGLSDYCAEHSEDPQDPHRELTRELCARPVAGSPAPPATAVGLNVEGVDVGVVRSFFNGSGGGQGRAPGKVGIGCGFDEQRDDGTFFC